MIVDLFAGPGGWSEGLRLLGLADFGLEHDAAACATRYEAGHASWQVDVTTVDPFVFDDVDGLIASPPCTDFSSSGKRQGLVGDTGHLVYEILRWADALTPRWIACEQVPAVVPIWKMFARHLEKAGYSTACGIVDAADFGVPQHRRRAVLLASRSETVRLPVPVRAATAGLFDACSPWTTMADALGLPEGCVYDSGQNSRVAGGKKERYVRSCDRPAGTVTGQTTSQWVILAGELRLPKLTLADAAKLQGFRSGYPFQGTREEQLQQVGNAVPPPLAAAVLREVVGSVLEAAA